MDIQKSLNRFWEIEEFDISKQNLSVVDKEIMKNCEENIKIPKNSGEPFEIPTPWKLEKYQLKLNANQAMDRLH